MKTQASNPDEPDSWTTPEQLGLDGFWQVGAADISALLPGAGQPHHGPTLLRLIAAYYQRSQFISTFLAAQATTGVFATLKDDPEFPRGLSRKHTDALVRRLRRDGLLVSETYKRGNRSPAERWAVIDAPAGAGDTMHTVAQG